ncbi:MAG TPA: hypothetical protein VJS43_15895, partial [Candidatus Acidoferrales bacterium]|nr:hypothetical protein [Candidatus Acidoferrales bacterium]
MVNFAGDLSGVRLATSACHRSIDRDGKSIYAEVLPAFSIAMPTIDEDLNQIERDIRTLKIEYEQFFGGGRKRPPTDTQWRLDNLVRRCNEKMGELNFGQRFKLSNLTQTYAKYQDFWRKKMIQRETGAQ